MTDETWCDLCGYPRPGVECVGGAMLCPPCGRALTPITESELAAMSAYTEEHRRMGNP